MASEKVVEKVRMNDGREVEFAGKKRLDKTLVESKDGTPGVRLDFRNGETRTVYVHPKLMNRAAAHGYSQKLGDSIAAVEDLDDAVETIDQLIARLDAGEWAAEREGGSGLSGVSILAKALVEATGQTIEVVRDYLSKLEPKVKMALRADPTIAPIVKRLEAEKAAKSKVSNEAATAAANALAALRR
jgi:hypothetical protein